jgi:hypothetical protein
MVTLYAPETYVRSSDKVRSLVVNGCGPGGWKVDIIPDTIYGLDISPACNVHDWMYTGGETLADKEEADRVFLNNMLRIIDAAGGWWVLRQLRRRRARVYYEAVQHFGGPAFWSGKNKKDNCLTT